VSASTERHVRLRSSAEVTKKDGRRHKTDGGTGGSRASRSSRNVLGSGFGWPASNDCFLPLTRGQYRTFRLKDERLCYEYATGASGRRTIRLIFLRHCSREGPSYPNAFSVPQLSHVKAGYKAGISSNASGPIAGRRF
jgi:hypothetical protein